MAVGRRHHIVGHDIGMLIADALGHLARGQIIEPDIGQPGDLRIQQRDIDVLALTGLVAMMEGGQDRRCGIHAAHDIGDADADLHRRPVGLARHAHDAAETLGQHVVARPRRIGPVWPKPVMEQ